MGYPLSFLSGHGEAADEFDEAFTIALRRDWGNLRFVVGESFPDMLRFLYETVLRNLSAAVLT